MIDDNEIKFADVDRDVSLDSIKGNGFTKYAMALAAGSGLNMIVFGPRGSLKTALLNRFYQLLPLLSEEEQIEANRINVACGLGEAQNIRPFRVPHYTASLEGMIGGGKNLRPGEITLAHNGVLFLDDIAEFRTCVLQALRVPLERKKITLAREGVVTEYPANFQLIATAQHCLCGNRTYDDERCLCSEKGIGYYTDKFLKPLGSRFEIAVNVKEELSEFSLADLRRMVEKLRLKAKERGGLISSLDINHECFKVPFFLYKACDNANAEKLTRLSRAIADLYDKDKITKEDVNMATLFCNFAYQKKNIRFVTKTSRIRGFYEFN